MNRKLYNDLQEEIGTLANIIDESLEEKENACSWLVQLRENDILGFISMEDNREDINESTITISLLLYDVTELSKEGLFKLFSLNSDLLGCGLSTELIENAWKLFLVRRIPAESYKKGELLSNVKLMLTRYGAFQEMVEETILDNFNI